MFFTRYAHENGSEWNSITCDRAAMGDSLECLRCMSFCYISCSPLASHLLSLCLSPSVSLPLPLPRCSSSYNLLSMIIFVFQVCTRAWMRMDFLCHVECCLWKLGMHEVCYTSLSLCLSSFLSLSPCSPFFRFPRFFTFRSFSADFAIKFLFDSDMHMRMGVSGIWRLHR